MKDEKEGAGKFSMIEYEIPILVMV